MKLSMLISSLAVGIAASLSQGVWAQPVTAPEEATLQTTQQAFETDGAGRPAKAHAEALPKQFQVEPQVVESLRSAKQGWGEIGIRLALAQELTKVDAKTYPTMADALAKVGDLRAEGKGWGVIAKELGFKLGPVISEANRVRHELRTAEKGSEARSQKLEKELRKSEGDRGTHLQKIEHPESMSRPERPERPQRAERPEKPEKPGR